MRSVNKKSHIPHPHEYTLVTTPKHPHKVRLCSLCVLRYFAGIQIYALQKISSINIHIPWEVVILSQSSGPFSFVVSKEDWSLHRKGHQDQERHQQKVREAIKDNLPDLVTEENIILSGGKQIVKVPIRSLDEYRIIYNFRKQKHVGQGDGESQVGDVLGRDSQSAQPGKGEKAGDQPGQDTVEAEVNLEDLEDILFQDMELPHLKPKNKEEIEVKSIIFNDIRKKGMMSNIDKKRTLLENLRRNASSGNPGIHSISPDDLRYKTWDDIRTPHSNAVIIAMMDTSGSMGSFEKYCARSFFFWMTRFLRRQYEKVEIVFLAHHTEAKEVSEHDFFTRGESGERFVPRHISERLKLSIAATRLRSTIFIHFTSPMVIISPPTTNVA